MFTRQNLTVWFGDSPLAYQTGFQDPATTTMEGIYIFNIDLLCIISMIVIVVAWFLSLILNLFLDSSNSGLKDFTHSDSLEIVWTSIPAFVLLSLASPSFALLYSLDEISNPKLTFKILGHQWYWSYETSDFYACAGCRKFKYSSYLLTNEAIQENNYSGYFRNLETNKRVLIPINVHLRFLISSVDVLHSWTIPSLGVKVDACPGRLNQANVFLKRYGVFFGQCSEICGVNHGFMPIALVAVPSAQFHDVIVSNFYN